MYLTTQNEVTFMCSLGGLHKPGCEAISQQWLDILTQNLGYVLEIKR